MSNPLLARLSEVLLQRSVCMNADSGERNNADHSVWGQIFFCMCIATKTKTKFPIIEVDTSARQLASPWQAENMLFSLNTELTNLFI